MRLIGTLATQDDAARFGDYLLTLGLRNHVEPSSDGQSHLVWIEHDDNIEQGQLHLREFQANPNDPKYAEAATLARRVRQEAAKATERRRRNFTDVRTSWSGLPSGGTTVTLIVAALCVVVFLIQQTKAGPTLDEWLLFYQPIWTRDISTEQLLERMSESPELLARYEAGGRLPLEMIYGPFGLRDAFAQVAQGQVWRLITPAIMHGGIGHILFNTLAFLTFGAMIETRKGTRLMLGLVLGAAVISCAGQAFWDGITPHGGMGFVGLSGVNYALFGYAWMRGRVAPQERIGASQQTVGMMVTWLLLCMTGWIGPIANAAHVIGLLVGVTIGLWPRIRRKMLAR